MTLRQWARQWQDTAKKLDEIRFENIRNTVTSDAIIALSEAFNHSLSCSILQPTSGLINQQKIFQKIRLKPCKI